MIRHFLSYFKGQVTICHWLSFFIKLTFSPSLSSHTSTSVWQVAAVRTSTGTGPPWGQSFIGLDPFPFHTTAAPRSRVVVSLGVNKIELGSGGRWFRLSIPSRGWDPGSNPGHRGEWFQVIDEVPVAPARHRALYEVESPVVRPRQLARSRRVVLRPAEVELRVGRTAPDTDRTPRFRRASSRTKAPPRRAGPLLTSTRPTEHAGPDPTPNSHGASLLRPVSASTSPSSKFKFRRVVGGGGLQNKQRGVRGGLRVCPPQ